MTCEKCPCVKMCGHTMGDHLENPDLEITRCLLCACTFTTEESQRS